MKPTISRMSGFAGRGGMKIALALGLVAHPAARLCAQDSFPTRAPAPAPLKPVQFPPFQEVLLPSGMTLLVVENHEQPTLSVTLAFRGGSRYDSTGKEGTAELVASVLTKGTPTRSADQISAAIEGVGGRIGASADDDFLTVSLSVLSDRADLAFDLLGDVLRKATFPAAEVDLARTQALSALALQLSEPSAVADRLFRREIYGSHPYGRSPTPDSYRAITQQDLAAFAAARIRPGGALLVMAGDVTLAQAKTLASKAFGNWRGKPAPDRPATLPAPKLRTDILLVHRPGSVQGNIVIGNTTFGPTDSGYYAARIATQVLGGGPDSRLFLILREQKSWTYGSYARMVRRRDVGSWQATFEGRNAVVDSALAEMLHQVDRIRTEAIPDSELTNVKGFLVGSFPLTIETPDQIAGAVANAKLLGLGTDYVRLYRERLTAVTAAQARTAALRTYRRNALTIVVVGDGAQLYEVLAKIAPVRIVDVDGAPLNPADLQPRASDVALDRSQITARSDSFRIMIQGNPMGFMTATTVMGPDSLVYVEHTNLAGGMVEQRTTLRLDPERLTPRQVDQTGSTQGRPTEIHIAYADGRVKGSAATPQPDGSTRSLAIDTALVGGTWDDNAMNLLLPALPLAAGETFTLNVFESGQGQLKVMQVKVSDGGQVTVPAGTFDCWRLDLTGGQVPVVMSVVKASPRRIVKIELVGAPFVFELAK